MILDHQKLRALANRCKGRASCNVRPEDLHALLDAVETAEIGQRILRDALISIRGVFQTIKFCKIIAPAYSIADQGIDMVNQALSPSRP
jgi:hypothetical protein